jgi:hypothetical protein
LKALITSFKNMTGLWDLDPDDSAWCVSCAAVLRWLGCVIRCRFGHSALDASQCGRRIARSAAFYVYWLLRSELW